MNLSLFIKSFERGFLLLEYLIALALFSLVLLYGDAIFALHARVKQKIEVQHKAITQLRQVQLQLQPIIAQAGYLGCQNVTNARQTIVHDGINTLVLKGTTLAVQKESGQHILLLEQVGEWSVSLSQAMQEVSDPLTLPSIPAENYQWFIIDDCQTAEIFAADVVQYANVTKLQSRQDLSKVYQQHAVVSPWVMQSFYVTDGHVLQSKMLLPEQAALSLHNNIYSWKLTLWPNSLQINIELPEEHSLWFAY